MKKRIAFLIALLMILCLALSGCGQRDNNPGAIKTDTEPGGSSETMDPVETTEPGEIIEPSEFMEPGETTEPSESADPNEGEVEPSEPTETDSPDNNVDNTIVNVSNYKNPPAIGDKYVFTVDGHQMLIRTEIWDYIFADSEGNLIFNYYDLAIDLGWTCTMDEVTDLGQATMFMLADELKPDVKRVDFGIAVDEKFDRIEYVYARGASDDAFHYGFISFDRLDISKDDVDTFYLNTSANSGTINLEMAIVSCYLLENITDDSINDPLEPILSGDESHAYTIHR